VKIKAANPAALLAGLPAGQAGGASAGPNLALIQAFFELNHLKQLYRQGWLRAGVPEARCESVAEHGFSMALLGWWVAGAAFPELDVDRILRLTLVHELGEIYTGDLTPGDAVAPEEKHRLEREGLWKVVGKLPRGAETMALWEEFERGDSPEARFVRQLDRLEMGFQAAVYSLQGFGDMEQFFASAAAAQTDDRLMNLFERLQAEISG
jgi:putative hydrolase of HD superfamily